MYKIEKKPSGFLITLAGVMSREELQQWYDESVEELATAPKNFGVIVDMQTAAPMPLEDQKWVIKVQELFKNKGMERSAVVLTGAIVTNQFKRMAIESGIHDYERYIDAEKTPDWVHLATDWVINGNDPDK
jgi:hypothetical protein